MNGLINTILIGLFALGGVYLGFWLGQRKDEKKSRWEFYKNATIEVLSIINLLDTDIIRFNLNSVSEQFIKHLQKFNEIKISLEVLKEEETLKNFKEFYNATIKFADEVRKTKNKKDLEELDSYKQFKIKKEGWFGLIRKKLEIK